MIFYFNNVADFFSFIFDCLALYFQDSASPQMEAIVELHNNIMYFLAVILFGVGWILISVVKNFIKNKSASNKYLNHGTLELIWTITPALILILIAFPSFKLLFLIDDVTDPHISLSVESHQWYWSYQYADFTKNEDGSLIEFDSYLVPESDLEKGGLRLLEVEVHSLIAWLSENSSPGSSSISDSSSNNSNTGQSGGGSDSGSYSGNCIHGVQGECGQCLASSHDGTITNCTHSWDILDHQGDDGFINAPCDIRNVDVCIGVATENGYVCHSCNAISCPLCCEGYETYPASDSSNASGDNT